MKTRWCVALASVVVGCSHPAAPPPPVPAPAIVAPVAAPVVAPPPPPAPPTDPAFTALDLGFEQVDGDRLTAWSPGMAGFAHTAVTSPVHGGAHALRIQATTGGEFSAAITHANAVPFIGKHLRLRGWIRADAVVGGAAMFLRVDGGEGAFDNMGDHAITGTHDWTEASVDVDVGPGATAIVFGPMLVGGGTAYFDDLRVEVTPIVVPPPPHPIAIDGTVVDAHGPVAGAEVAAISTDEIAQHVETDARGHFHFAVTSGKWGVSAHHAGAVGAFVEQVSYDADVRDLQLALPATGGVTVHGRMTTPMPAGSYVQISPFSTHDADLFAVPIAADGAFEAVLPAGDKYNLVVLGSPFGTGKVADRVGDRVDVELALAPFAPAPPAVSDYIAAHAIALATVEAGHGFADMAAIGALVGDAHVVALGEATHGSRELFQLKHRFVEYLVAKRGFTVFAIEANQPECRAINDYVLHGTGTARAALAGIYFWTWNTEEVLAMIEWMRTWNADPAHVHKVEFTGFDMQTATVAYANAAAFLRATAPADAEALLAPLATLAGKGSTAVLAASDADARTKLGAALAAVGTAMDAHRRAPGFADARHDVTILAQFVDFSTHEAQSFDIRDQAMADNLAWLRAQRRGARIVVWAHNAHIANELAGEHNFGSHLRAAWRADYVNFGFLFGSGAFQAIDRRLRSENLGEITLGPATELHASAAFARTGKPLLVLDLRKLPARGAVHDWFAAPHPVRETGAVFFTERAMTVPQILPALYDAVIYVATTTRARPLK